MLWKKNHERQFEGSKVCHTKTTSGFFLLIDYKRELEVSILSFTFSNYFNSLCKKIGLYMCNPKKMTQSKSVPEHTNTLLDGPKPCHPRWMIQYRGAVAHGSVNILSTWFQFSFLLFYSLLLKLKCPVLPMN